MKDPCKNPECHVRVGAGIEIGMVHIKRVAGARTFLSAATWNGKWAYKAFRGGRSEERGVEKEVRAPALSQGRGRIAANRSANRMSWKRSRVGRCFSLSSGRGPG